MSSQHDEARRTLPATITPHGSGRRFSFGRRVRFDRRFSLDRCFLLDLRFGFASSLPLRSSLLVQPFLALDSRSVDRRPRDARRMLDPRLGRPKTGIEPRPRGGAMPRPPAHRPRPRTPPALRPRRPPARPMRPATPASSRHPSFADVPVGCRRAGATCRAGPAIAVPSPARAAARLRAPPAAWVEKGCARARLDATSAASSDAGMRAWLEARLQPFRVESTEGVADGLITGYFEPLVEASRLPKKGFRVPLYAPPADLASRRPYGPASRSIRRRSPCLRCAGARSPGSRIRSTR